MNDCPLYTPSHGPHLSEENSTKMVEGELAAAESTGRVRSVPKDAAVLLRQHAKVDANRLKRKSNRSFNMTSSRFNQQR